MDELDELKRNYCEVTAQGGVENIHGKVNVLMQTYLSRGRIKSFSLISDQAYITQVEFEFLWKIDSLQFINFEFFQNAVRICRALFEIVLRMTNAIMAGRMLSMAKMLELQQWDHMSPMRQFFCLPLEAIEKIEDRNLTIDRLKEMDVKEIGN